MRYGRFLGGPLKGQIREILCISKGESMTTSMIKLTQYEYSLFNTFGSATSYGGMWGRAFYELLYEKTPLVDRDRSLESDSLYRWFSLDQIEYITPDALSNQDVLGVLKLFSLEE
jgi:hypothetical protein